jgi:hypothetical protein
MEEGDYRDDITVVVLTFPWLESYHAESPTSETNVDIPKIEA